MKPRCRVSRYGSICKCIRVEPADYQKELIEACKMPAHSFSENEIRRVLCSIAFILGACMGSAIGVLI